MYICETCREQVRPASDSSIVYAVELVALRSMGYGQSDVGEGLGVFFHASCYPVGSDRYRRKPMPAGIDKGDQT